MRYDVRAIRLIKYTKKIPVEKNEKVADFICLGHFDLIQIDDLSEREGKAGARLSPLEMIQRDRFSGREREFKCSVNNVYSLYMLRQMNNEEKELGEKVNFWREETIFTVVTRIHCDYGTEVEDDRIIPFSQKLFQRCKDLTLEEKLQRAEGIEEYESVVVLQVPVTGSEDSPCGSEAYESVTCMFYDSMELGDTVAVLKSNSVTAILETVQYISGDETVCDTYSYCGISCDFYEERGERWKGRVRSVPVPQMSTRFSVVDNFLAENYFRTFLKEWGAEKYSQFYITGTADRIICWKVCTEEDLLRIMGQMIKQSGQVEQCFNDIITRIGIEPQQRSKREKKKKETPISICYRKIVKWLLEEIPKTEEAAGWKYSLLKLLETLETMRRNSVMDDLARLLIPAVDAFLTLLWNRKENLSSKEIDWHYDGDITLFLDHWSNLVHDLVLLESQMTQHPELNPVRYYIPATLLEFELQFILECGDLLQDADRGKRREFYPMVVPTGDVHLSTRAPLDPRNSDYYGKCPLLVFVPIQDLYDPWACAHRMAHEIAHYSGDKVRSRETRKETLVQCMAWYLGHLYQEQYMWETNIRTISKENQGRARECLVDIVRERLKKYNSGHEWYMAETEKALYDVLKSILRDIRTTEKYMLAIDPEYFYHYGDVYRKSLNVKDHVPSMIEQIDLTERHMKLIVFLVPECYADLAMIALLDCSLETYYTCLFQKEYEHLLKIYGPNGTKGPYLDNVFLHVQRLAMVIAATYLDMGEGGRNPNPVPLAPSYKTERRPWLKDAIRMALEILDCIKMGQGDKVNTPNKSEWVGRLEEMADESPYILLMEEMVEVVKYLNECGGNLHALLDQNERVEDLRRHLQDLHAPEENVTFEWNNLQKYLLKKAQDMKKLAEDKFTEKVHTAR